MHTHILRLVLKHFAMMWLLTGVGAIVGMFLPRSITTPISIISLVLLIIVLFIRNVRLANTILYAIPFLTGITLFWGLSFFIAVLGLELVITVLIATVVIFIILALLGLKIPRDFSNWGTYLTAILIVVIIFSLIFMFVPISNTIGLILAAVCVLLFALYTVYDFNLIRNNYINEDNAISMALGLYLDFVNLFMNLLEIVWRLKEED